METQTIPWVEKYRPNTFNNIILNDYKKQIYANIISKKVYFPNMIFFGPPGTGKTTTIINMINEMYKDTNDTPQVIHLNASDDRGIDIIRTNILQFVYSNGLFKQGLKFVILDETDYMTRAAQLALKYLIEHTYTLDVRYCLICNYISKIDNSLAQNFLLFKFNSHPREKIFNFLKNILVLENISINDGVLNNIIDTYNSDIRSMINYMQMNTMNMNKKKPTIEQIIVKLKSCNKTYTKKIQYFEELATKIDLKNTDLIKKIITYTFQRQLKTNSISKNFLDTAANLYHNLNNTDKILIIYFYNNILPFL